ncbi:hypothetical protein BGX28_007041 [Mortierella sp. GBA30]|nr:hypothetical protein BGX28_007041 [Mortierella sp. GBA30]
MYSVGSFFSTVTKFYNEINPATLSGAIDIIVVQQANGDLACSPFHVRFGKLSVLRPQEKVVEVRVNGEVIAFPMKVGDAGEAFFVLETDDYVPDEFATSPIAGPSDEADLAPVDYFDLNSFAQASQQRAQQQQQQQQHQQHQRTLLEGMSGQYPRGDEDDAPLDNGYVSAASGHGSAFEESLKDDSDHESVFSGTSPSAERVKEDTTNDMSLDLPGSFGPTILRNSLDDKESIKFPVNAIFPTIVHEEAKGDLVDRGSASRRRRSEIVFDMTGYKTDSCSDSSDNEDDLPRGILSDSERHSYNLPKKFRKNKSHISKEQREQLIEDIKHGAFPRPEENIANTHIERRPSRAHRRKKRVDIPSAWQGRKGRKRANSMPSIGEPDIPISAAVARGPDRLLIAHSNKGDMVTEVQPKRTIRPSVMSDTEMEYESNVAVKTTQGKEWSWGWGTLPVKQNNPDEEDEVKEKGTEEKAPETPIVIETKEFQMGSTKCHVALSLCGEDDFGKDLVTSHKAFQSSQLTFELFSKDPAAILSDKRLVCYMDGRFYTWNNAVPQLAALLFFHQPLPDGTVSLDIKDQKSLVVEDRPSATRFGTISRWFRKTPAGSASPSTTEMASASSATLPNGDAAVAVGSEDDEAPVLNKALRSKSLPPMETGRADSHDHTHTPVPTLSEKAPEGTPDKKRYAKTLRLTSEQLRSLGLKKGANTVSFSVTSSYQGIATCVAKIFLWDYDSQVVISDIDGTITKSDALGHIFAMAGRDWTHLGVAKLFTDIRSNGYHILYLTSRAIGQADYTRKYLQKVEQNSYQLPDGPVIMSPDRLFSAFHREVIIRKPEVFKMACLRDVKKLFGDRNPFYAGFGNRITDALSYRSVNVPPSRIFTIDSYGEVKLELLSAFKSSYLALNDLVNEIFPGQRVAPEFNDWNYWKSDLPKIDLPDLPVPTNNYGTMGSSTSLLSSTTSVAKKVVSLTSSSSSSSLLQPTSPTSPTGDFRNKRLSSDRGTYAGALLGRQETWTSDDEYQDQQQKHIADDTVPQTPGSEQQHKAGQDLKDDARKARSGSPSMLSALVPSRLIRAVRSGSISSQTNPVPSSMRNSTTPHSPEMKGIIGSLPSPSSPTFAAGEEMVRRVSIPSPPSLDGLLQTDEEVAQASSKALDLQQESDQAILSRPSSFNAKSDVMDDLVPVKEEEEEDKRVRLTGQPFEDVDPSSAVYGEDGYEGDYADQEGEGYEGEGYEGEEGEGYDEDGEMDEDDEYLDEIEENLEEQPFL